jgi:hypothetical protein
MKVPGKSSNEKSDSRRKRWEVGSDLPGSKGKNCLHQYDDDWQK